MITRVVIIDYGMGNVASVQKAIRKLGVKTVLSNKPSDIKKATHLILPGVGAFGDGIKNLKKTGLIDLLTQKVVKYRTPFLGICLGMQLLAERGHEFGLHDGLGWIKGETVRLRGDGLRLIHIGWNNIKILKNKKLLQNLPDNNFYFVHSYILKPEKKSIISATCRYGEEFAAAVEQENIFGTQFHPEKSQVSGIKLLENFLQYEE